jgi:hypothetical protein
MKLAKIRDEYGDLYLVRDDQYLKSRIKRGKCERVDEPATTAEYVEFCEAEAESANYHYLTPVYSQLLEVIQRHATPEATTNIMREIAELGGMVP